MDVQLFAVLVAFFFFTIQCIYLKLNRAQPCWHSTLNRAVPAQFISIYTDNLKRADLCPHAFRFQCKQGISLRPTCTPAIEVRLLSRDCDAT